MAAEPSYIFIFASNSGAGKVITNCAATTTAKRSPSRVAAPEYGGKVVFACRRGARFRDEEKMASLFGRTAECRLTAVQSSTCVAFFAENAISINSNFCCPCGGRRCGLPSPPSSLSLCLGQEYFAPCSAAAAAASCKGAIKMRCFYCLPPSGRVHHAAIKVRKLSHLPM